MGAEDSKIVQLTINGKTQTVPTRANNVKDLLSRVGVELHEADVIEPALDTPIYEDNFSVNIFRARPVTITDNKNIHITKLSAYQEPRVIAQLAGVSLYEEDDVTLQRDEELLPDSNFLGEKVVIVRAVPAFINLYGTSIPVRTHAKTVDELLKEKNIQTIAGDTVQPTLDSSVTENLQIFVLRKGKKIVSEEVSVPAPVETVDDKTIAFGQTVVKQEGSPGRKLVTYEIESKDGKEIGRKIIQEVVIAKPKKRIVAKGTKSLIAANITGSKLDWMKAVGISSDDYRYVDYIISRESGWCPTKWQGQYGVCPDFYQELYSPTSSRGYGLCQATPPGKMQSAGSDWETNPVTQLRWCSNYAINRYGSWQQAYEFWVVNHWW